VDFAHAFTILQRWLFLGAQAPQETFEDKT
jgi:hypothetical protein